MPARAPSSTLWTPAPRCARCSGRPTRRRSSAAMDTSRTSCVSGSIPAWRGSRSCGAIPPVCSTWPSPPREAWSAQVPPMKHCASGTYSRQKESANMMLPSLVQARPCRVPRLSKYVREMAAAASYGEIKEIWRISVVLECSLIVPAEDSGTIYLWLWWPVHGSDPSREFGQPVSLPVLSCWYRYSQPASQPLSCCWGIQGCTVHDCMQCALQSRGCR
mmetsp:Transcript_13203/g.22090  ORF Transcript_13203/g.22090 Transcript_13203/m.22090 type:complete len:218 (+) Transcript_13203:1102-1755(+)